jgi:hypothetical protein
LGTVFDGFVPVGLTIADLLKREARFTKIDQRCKVANFPEAYLKSLVSLALAGAWNRRGTLGLMAISIALSVILLLGVEQLRTQAREFFAVDFRH